MIEPLVATEPFPIAVQIEPVWQMTEDEFFQFCQINRNLRIEKTAEGEIIIMPPTGGVTGNRNAAITAVLYLWAIKNGTGVAFDSSTGFTCPMGPLAPLMPPGYNGTGWLA